MTHSIKVKLSDGDWTCRWVKDLCYSKNLYGDGIGVSCVVSYVNSAGLTQDVYAPLNNLYRTSTGMKLRVKDGVGYPLLSNAQQCRETSAALRREIYHIPVAEESLSAYSVRFYRHLNPNSEQHHRVFEEDSAFIELTSQLQLPPKFAHASVHRILNTNPAYSADYFIIPSYEVLRYFFLSGNRLSHELLSYFTGKADKGARVCQGIQELVVHPTGEPLIALHRGKRTAFLEVKEGLSKAEIACLARIAFLPPASSCLAQVREDLLLNAIRRNAIINIKSSDGKDQREYKTFRTKFPQNKPFTIAACGREFSWQGKSYVLVDQIFDTKEELPYDQLSYLPLEDHRSKAIPSNQAAQTHEQRPHRAKTVPASSPQLTADELGNANEPAVLTDFLETISVFGAKPEIVKLPKQDQTNQYHTTPPTQEQAEQLSLLDQGKKEAEAGRVRVMGDDSSKLPDTHSQVRNIFGALKSLRRYSCAYLNLDLSPYSFQPGYYFNTARPGLPYGVVLGLLQPLDKSVQANVYFAWASTLRFALFCAPALRPLSLVELFELYSTTFGKQGLIIVPAGKQFSYYHRHNPEDSTVEQLVGRIENAVADIIDDNIAALR